MVSLHGFSWDFAGRKSIQAWRPVLFTGALFGGCEKLTGSSSIAPKRPSFISVASHNSPPMPTRHAPARKKSPMVSRSHAARGHHLDLRATDPLTP